jgi:hypothetical protein
MSARGVMLHLMMLSAEEIESSLGDCTGGMILGSIERGESDDYGGRRGGIEYRACRSYEGYSGYLLHIIVDRNWR